MNTMEQVTADFEDHFKYVESMGDDCRSSRFDFEHNAQHYVKNDYHICVKCKQPERSSYVEPTKSRLIADKTCFGCDLWAKREPTFNTGNVFVVDNNMYSIGSPAINLKGNQSHLGHGGRGFEITTNDGVKHLTNNLWCGGGLPFWLKHHNVGNTMRVAGILELKGVKEGPAFK